MNPQEWCKSIIGFVATDTSVHFIVVGAKWVCIHLGLAAIAVGRAKLRGA